MRRKGAWVLTILLGLWLSLGGWTLSWAGEMDAKQLINLLQKKGIITQEEANSLMEEAQSKATKEKTEIKSEIKSEIKADMKGAAEKGEFLTHDVGPTRPLPSAQCSFPQRPPRLFAEKFTRK